MMSSIRVSYIHQLNFCCEYNIFPKSITIWKLTNGKKHTNKLPEKTSNCEHLQVKNIFSTDPRVVVGAITNLLLGDSLLVKKWQERYEECMKEKEDLMSKLKVFSRINESTPNSKWTSNSVISGNHSPGTASFGSVSKGTLEQSYIDLKDEYKVSI